MLLQLKENTVLAVIARMMGISHSSVYHLFYNHITVKARSYHLKSVISIDEFRATTDKVTYTFHIGDPINGKTVDIVDNRKDSCLKRYFQEFPYNERKK